MLAERLASCFQRDCLQLQISEHHLPHLPIRIKRKSI
uniref:Uncharacterized protein n=1 Tax=Anguilla anguilla TaxID=7936 RepID=A0A0E9PM18_ANGAN